MGQTTKVKPTKLKPDLGYYGCSGSYLAKRAKKQLKSKKIVSPDLSKLVRVQVEKGLWKYLTPEKALNYDIVY